MLFIQKDTKRKAINTAKQSEDENINEILMMADVILNAPFKNVKLGIGKRFNQECRTWNGGRYSFECPCLYSLH